ncbi:TPA: shikimate kinase, partial [Klebsiella oxytoca]|nr:shikimate kinase [Klebsiella oxytoca]
VYEKMIVYIIGPGGAGKTTTGRLVAELLGWTAIDLDQAFCQYIMNIRQFIKQFGYEKYVIRNSLLLNELLVERTGLKSVFILSSGFLSTDICQEILPRAGQRPRLRSPCLSKRLLFCVISRIILMRVS